MADQDYLLLQGIANVTPSSPFTQSEVQLPAQRTGAFFWPGAGRFPGWFLCSQKGMERCCRGTPLTVGGMKQRTATGCMQNWNVEEGRSFRMVKPWRGNVLQDKEV